jgi:predicted O-methyltransferase YrrM
VTKNRSTITLTYPIRPVPRYGNGHPPHPVLFDIINRRRREYRQRLEGFLSHRELLLRIPRKADAHDGIPCWMNGYLPGLDAVALYGLVSERRPKHYLEIGSGQSTRFARRAAADHGLDMRVISIDPQPRADIDAICDQVIRQPLEEVDLSVFDQVEPGDVVFFDGSHYCFMNSDATVFFLDVLPRLRPGTLVQIHDIMLPYDYPLEWVERYYSEQYLLAVYLLARTDRTKIILPNAFVTEDDVLSKALAPLWNNPHMQDVEWHGGSFWFEV